MALIPCPECKREISSAASACPHCGFPNPATDAVQPAAPSGPSCYACSALATTRCVKCGALSCATHLKNIYVRQDPGGGNELRCRECYAEAERWNRLGLVGVGVVFVIMILLFLLTTSLR